MKMYTAYTAQRNHFHSINSTFMPPRPHPTFIRRHKCTPFYCENHCTIRIIYTAPLISYHYYIFLCSSLTLKFSHIIINLPRLLKRAFEKKFVKCRRMRLWKIFKNFWLIRQVLWRAVYAKWINYLSKARPTEE